MIGGLVASLLSGTIGMAQVERGANRIYGAERDRPAVRRFVVAFGLNLSAGTLLLLAFAILASGRALTDALLSAGWSDTAGTAWTVAKWPIGAAVVGMAFTMIFKIGPNRHQPQASWLAAGMAVSAVLWLLFTGLLSGYVGVNEQLGETFGPLLGIIGLLLWAYLSSMALLLGMAFAAQLEAVRARVPKPRRLT